MGLYLCIFDDADNELGGVEVGSYGDFNYFRDIVISTVEKGRAGTVCPLLINHSDSDGEWRSEQARDLLTELGVIAKIMRAHPPVEFNSAWKKEVANTFDLHPQSLLECFFDIDGELLVERLVQIAHLSISTGQPILFQ